jgi:beta-mannosidase
MKHVMDIREGWQLQGLPYRDFSLDRLREEAWLPARVPGDVHTNLIENGVITDPSLGTGDVQAAWVERQVWVYRGTVRPDAVFGGARRALLRFAGLDTLCDVFWDGRQIASFANMLVEHVCALPEPVGAQPHTLQLVF